MRRHEWNKRIILMVIFLTITGCITAVWGQAIVPYTLYTWYEKQLENATKTWQDIVETETTQYQLELITQIRQEIEVSMEELEAYMEENQSALQAELERKKAEQLLLYREKAEQEQETMKDQITTTTSSALFIEEDSAEERERLYVEE